MIKSLSITNFQSHKDSEFQFDNGVNILVGASDSGKTAIIRALRWLIWNRPSGDTIRSTWGGKTSVELFTDDAHVVRSKDKEAEYILGDTHFKAFSTDVPKEISDALNILEINLQSQLDSPFLLSESPGNVASYFNKIAHLDMIDTSTQNINSWIRELTNDIKYSEGQELSLQEEIKKFAHLEKFEIEVEVLEQLESQSKNLNSRFEKLYSLIGDWYHIQDKIKYFEDTLKLEKPLNAILDLIDLRAEKDIEVVKLDRLVVQIEKVQVEIDEQKDLISVEKPVLEVLGMYEKRNIAVERQKGLYKQLYSLSHISTLLEGEKRNYIGLQEKFEKAMPIGSICVLCGQKIKG